MVCDLDASTFLNVIRPALARGDAERLARLVQSRWRPSQIRRLVDHPHAHVRCAAAVVLGLVGSMPDAPCLTHALRDREPQMVKMAEDALWSIWFRAGNADAGEPFRQGMAAMASQAYEEAVDCFGRAVEADPSFAEAYHQRAIARFFLARWACALEDCTRTVRLVPSHFGALAGMGHCHVYQRQFLPALQCYRQALQIHPQLGGIADVVARLEAHVSQGDPNDRFELARVPV